MRRQRSPAESAEESGRVTYVEAHGGMLRELRRSDETCCRMAQDYS